MRKINFLVIALCFFVATADAKILGSKGDVSHKKVITWDLENSAVSHWKMNENAANTNVVDSVGPNTGTAAQNTSAIATGGVVGGGFSFDGAADWVSVATNATLNAIGSTITVSMWLSVSDTAGQVDVMEFYKGAAEKFFIAIDAAGGLEGFNDIDDAGQAISTAATTIAWDTWYHIVFTIDRTLFTFYVNGIQDTNPTTLTDDFGNLDDGYAISLGKSISNGRFVDGIMDNVSIYDRVLSEKEIEILYDDGKGTERLKWYFY
jgi:hypothetical protein